MDESPTDAGNGAAADPGLPRYGFRIISQYLKDLSFENINPPAAENEPEETPHGVVQVDLKASRYADKSIDVIVHLRVEATIKDDPAYVVEIEYGGRFTFEDLPPNILEMLALVEAPRLLFPFMRVIIANITRDGGYPTLILNPIDFAGIYRAQRGQQGPPTESMEGRF